MKKKKKHIFSVYVYSEITQGFLCSKTALSSVIGSPLYTATNKDIGKIKSVFNDMKNWFDTTLKKEARLWIWIIIIYVHVSVKDKYLEQILYRGIN